MTRLSYFMGGLVCSGMILLLSTSSLRANSDTPALAANQQEKEVTVKNTCERTVAVFAGPKEEIRNPQLKICGGRSNNTVFVKPNDVVCLMTDDKKPVACTVVKSETKEIEVNSSGTGISGK